MQVFGVDADVDALCSRRRIKAPNPEATRTEHFQRAARHGDIVDITRRRRFEAKGAAGASVASLLQHDVVLSAPPLSLPRSRSGGILPNSDTYDMPIAGRCSRRYFDGTTRAKCYAELVGRSRLPRDGSPTESSRDAEDPGLPLALRRVLAATMPGSCNPDFSYQALEHLKMKVEAKVRHRYTERRSVSPCRQRMSRKMPEGRAIAKQLQPEQRCQPELHKPELEFSCGVVRQQYITSEPLGENGPPASEVVPATCSRLFSRERRLTPRPGPGESPEGPEGWDPDLLEMSSDSGNLTEIPEDLSEAAGKLEEMLWEAESISPRELGFNDTMLTAARSAALEAVHEVAAARESLPTLLTSRSQRISLPRANRPSWAGSDDSEKLGSEFES